MNEINIKVEERFNKLSKYCGAISNPRRIALLTKVAADKNSLKNILVDVKGLNPFAVSINLKYLKKFGLIKGNLAAKKMEYQIDLESLEEFKGLFDEFYLTLKESK